MNRVTLIGNLTRAPEVSETPNGTSVCKFSLAIQRNYADANGERQTDFFNIITWKGLAENCGKYLAKGKKAAVSGQLQNRTYDDKNGNKRTVTEIMANEVEFIGGGKNETYTTQETAQTSKKKAVEDMKPVEDDDLPF